MVIRILRELKKWDEAAVIIESLVNNEKFESINAELLLELSNLLLTQNKLNESIDVFQQITEKYPKTIFSAEAYFNIGNYSLDIEKNYSKAKKMYGPINTWDVSKVTDMSNLFENKTTFNSNISNWNTSKVKR